jgi:hypothetical protein
MYRSQGALCKAGVSYVENSVVLEKRFKNPKQMGFKASDL